MGLLYQSMMINEYGVLFELHIIPYWFLSPVEIRDEVWSALSKFTEMSKLNFSYKANEKFCFSQKIKRE
jgi:hypothetical protein